MSICIRKANKMDRRSIAELEKQNDYINYTIDEIDLKFEDSEYELIVAVDEEINVIIGFVLGEEKEDYFQIMQITIEKDYRHKIIGKLMYNYIFNMITDKKIKVFVPEEAEGFKTFNLKMGFENTDTINIYENKIEVFERS